MKRNPMTRNLTTTAWIAAMLTFVLVPMLMAGCAQQYNGALGFKTDDKRVFAEAQEYRRDQDASKASLQVPAQVSPPTDESSAVLKAMGPVESGVPSRQGVTATQNTGPGGQPEFTATPMRPENSSEAGPARRSQPVGVFGELPHTGGPGTGSPFDSPGNVAQVTFLNEGADFDPEIDPTGKLIVFASTRHRESPDIYMQKIGGTSVTQLTNDPARDIMPTFSPDGSHVAFASDRGGNWDIYIIDAAGGKATQITNSPTHDLHPSFSPDGTKLVYCSYGAKSGQWELVVVDLKNPATRQIIGNGLFPHWSPRGDKILFQRSRERGTRWFSVWTVDFVEGEARRATEVIAANNAAAITPSWSPDGMKIVFSTVMNPDRSDGDKPVQADVWVVAADGSSRVNLTSSRFANLQPTWSKDGSVYFVSNRGKDGIESVWSLRVEEPAREDTVDANP
ncbi:MAG: DPP IV N-terminal domain-containing protein [Phycisphaeraceae bacterium]